MDKIIMMILTAVIYGVGLSIYLFKDAVYCYNDIYCIAQSQLYIEMLMVAELYIIYNLRYEWRMSLIVRTGSMRKLWLRITGKIVRMSALITLYTFILCTIVAAFTSVYQCNWTDSDSYAFYTLLRHLNIEIDTWIVQFVYILIVFTEISVMGMFITLLWWWLRQPVYGYTAMVAYAVIEKQYLVNKCYFFKTFTMDNTYMYLEGLRVNDQIIFPIAACMTAFLIGLILLRHRDMLRKDSDI